MSSNRILILTAIAIVIGLVLLTGCTVHVDARITADNGGNVEVIGNTLATSTDLNTPSLSSGIGQVLPRIFGVPGGV